jgi:hypothetical protein
VFSPLGVSPRSNLEWSFVFYDKRRVLLKCGRFVGHRDINRCHDVGLVVIIAEEQIIFIYSL